MESANVTFGYRYTKRVFLPTCPRTNRFLVGRLDDREESGSFLGGERFLVSEPVVIHVCLSTITREGRSCSLRIPVKRCGKVGCVRKAVEVQVKHNGVALGFVLQAKSLRHVPGAAYVFA